MASLGVLLEEGLEFLLPTEADVARAYGLGAFLRTREQVDYGPPWLVEAVTAFTHPVAANLSPEQVARAAGELSRNAELREAVAAAALLSPGASSDRLLAVAAVLRDAAG